MNKTKKSILGLSQSLFWDIDQQTLNPEKHAKFIIEKVLNMGTLDNFLIIKSY